MQFTDEEPTSRISANTRGVPYERFRSEEFQFKSLRKAYKLCAFLG